MGQRLNKIIGRSLQFAVVIAAMGCTAAFLSETPEHALKRGDGRSIHFVANKTYDTECSSCHVAYLPGFLPDRSWTKLMNGLEDHFGENASLDKPVNDELKKFLIGNAANSAKASARSKKIAKLIAPGEAPIRITETPFWERKHSAIKGYVWKREKVGSKARCDSCHRDANKGIFTEHDVHVPKA